MTLEQTNTGYHWSVLINGQLIEGSAPTETAALRAIARAEHDHRTQPKKHKQRKT